MTLREPLPDTRRPTVRALRWAAPARGGGVRWYAPRKSDNADDIWRIPVDLNNERQHTTQKPVAVVERAVENSSQAGDAILDPFVGSGTTIIAAERLQRRAYAMEIEPRYVDVSVRRWEAYTGQEARRG